MRRSAHRFTVLLGLCATLPLVAASSPPQNPVGATSPSSAVQAGPVPGRVVDAGTATIVGRVVDDATGAPVEGVRVTRWSATGAPGGGASPQYEVISDSLGQFLYRNVPAGQFHIVAENPGYFSGGLGRERPDGPSRTLAVGEGALITDVTLRLWPKGVLTGTVLDEAGEPAVGVAVQAIRRQAAIRQLGEVLFFTWPSLTTTDDRGIFRLALLPGEWVVMLQPTVVITVPADLAEATAASGPAARLPGQLYIVDVPIGAGHRIGDTIVFPSSSGRPSLPARVGDDGTTYVHEPAFAPGPPTESGEHFVTLAPGETRSGLNMRARLVRGVRLAGRVSGPDGPVAGMGLRLTQGSSLSLRTLDVASTITDANGRFTLIGVPPGQYVVRGLDARRPAQTAPNATIVTADGASLPMASSVRTPARALTEGPLLWVDQHLVVGDADVEQLDLTLRRGARLRGRVIFESESAQPNATTMQRITVSALDIDSRFSYFPTNRPDASGEFATSEYPGGRYFAMAAAVPGWTLKGVMHKGTNLLDVPFDISGEDFDGIEVIYTDRPTPLSGTVRNGKGAPDATALVVMFPADAARKSIGMRQMQTARTTIDGGYTFAHVPAGVYRLAAVPDAESPNWRLPPVLDILLANATVVTVHESGTVNQPLTTLSVPPGVRR